MNQEPNLDFKGREFLMKDLYSAHLTEEDLDKYYWEVADAYFKIFKRFGLDAKIVEAAGEYLPIVIPTNSRFCVTRVRIQFFIVIAKNPVIASLPKIRK